MPITHETALVAEPERRFRAFAVDRAIAWTLFAASAVAAWWWFFRDGKVWPGIAIIAVTVVVVSLALAVILGIKGTSPGRSMMGLRVVSVEGGEPIGVPRAIFRSFIVGIGSLPMFGLGLATLAWTAVEDRTRERRGWHDHVAGSVVIDVRPRPVAEVEADERPRHVVNLTAMKLMPVRQQPAPVVPAPEPAPPSAPVGQPIGEPIGGQAKEPSGFETPESRRRRIDTPWPASGSDARSAPEPPSSPQFGAQQPESHRPGPQQSAPQQPAPQQPAPQQPAPQHPAPQQPAPQQPGTPGSLQGPPQSAPQSAPQPAPHSPGRHAGPATPNPTPGAAGPPGVPPQPAARPNSPSSPQPGMPPQPGPQRAARPNSQSAPRPAPQSAPRPAAQPAPQPGAGQRRAQPPRPPIDWRVTFDTGESFVVEGLGIVGRQPSGRPGEPVRHVVPLRSDDMSISKTHAQFHIAADGALVVIDRGSTNGSLLLRKGVSRELIAGRPATLVDGDRVCFGDRQMTVTRER